MQLCKYKLFLIDNNIMQPLYLTNLFEYRQRYLPV
jgi:hypothetical protein